MNERMNEQGMMNVEYLNEEHTPRGVGWGFGLNIVTTSELAGGGGPTTQTSRSQVLVQPYPNLKKGLG